MNRKQITRNCQVARRRENESRGKKERRNYLLWIALVSRLTSMDLRENRRTDAARQSWPSEGYDRVWWKNDLRLYDTRKEQGALSPDHRSRFTKTTSDRETKPRSSETANRTGRGPSTGHRRHSARPNDPWPPFARYLVE